MQMPAPGGGGGRRKLAYGALTSATVGARSGPDGLLSGEGGTLIQSSEDIGYIVHNSDTGSRSIVTGPVVLQKCIEEKDGPAVFECESRLHPGSAARTGLHHHRDRRVPAHHRVPHGEGCPGRR